MLNEHMVENRYHDDVFPFVRLGHLVMAALGVLAELGSRREPLATCQKDILRLNVDEHTKDAASSVLEEM